jgi:hypothetical protein
MLFDTDNGAWHAFLIFDKWVRASRKKKLYNSVASG